MEILTKTEPIKKLHLFVLVYAIRDTKNAPNTVMEVTAMQANRNLLILCDKNAEKGIHDIAFSMGYFDQIDFLKASNCTTLRGYPINTRMQFQHLPTRQSERNISNYSRNGRTIYQHSFATMHKSILLQLTMKM